MPALLLNHVAPHFEIFIPVDGSWRKFRGGKLELDESDPAYEIVLAVATADPNIEIHYADPGTDEAPKPRRVKKQAGIACDACKPAQVFDTEQELQDHLKIVHMALPRMDEDGNEIGRRDAEDEGPAPTSIPAATRKK